MISKFAPITKLKKEKLESLRRSLMQVNHKIHQIEEEISTTKNELLSYDKPSHGPALLFSQYAMMTETFKKRINMAKEKLYYAMQEKNVVQTQVNGALIEFEKFKYLQTQEEEAHRLKMKKEEALLLDEVALMSYNLQQGSKR